MNDRFRSSQVFGDITAQTVGTRLIIFMSASQIVHRTITSEIRARQREVSAISRLKIDPVNQTGLVTLKTDQIQRRSRHLGAAPYLRAPACSQS